MSMNSPISPHPDKVKTMELLSTWNSHYAAVEKMMDGITTSIGLDINGPKCATAVLGAKPARARVVGRRSAGQDDRQVEIAFEVQP